MKDVSLQTSRTGLHPSIGYRAEMRIPHPSKPGTLYASANGASPEEAAIRAGALLGLSLEVVSKLYHS